MQCPGKILVQAGVKGFTGGTSMNYALPEMIISAPFSYSQRPIFIHPIDGSGYQSNYSAIRENSRISQGNTDADGAVPRQIDDTPTSTVMIVGKKQAWLVDYPSLDTPSPVDWENDSDL